MKRIAVVFSGALLGQAVFGQDGPATYFDKFASKNTTYEQAMVVKVGGRQLASGKLVINHSKGFIYTLNGKNLAYRYYQVPGHQLEISDIEKRFDVYDGLPTFPVQMSTRMFGFPANLTPSCLFFPKFANSIGMYGYKKESETSTAIVFRSTATAELQDPGLRLTFRKSDGRLLVLTRVAGGGGPQVDYELAEPRLAASAQVIQIPSVPDGYTPHSLPYRYNKLEIGTPFPSLSLIGKNGPAPLTKLADGSGVLLIATNRTLESNKGYQTLKKEFVRRAGMLNLRVVEVWDGVGQLTEGAYTFANSLEKDNLIGTGSPMFYAIDAKGTLQFLYQGFDGASAVKEGKNMAKSFMPTTTIVKKRGK